MKEHRISKLNNKRGYSTEGSTLLPSVLRPRLFGVAGMIFGICIINGFVNNTNTLAANATLTVPDNISVSVNPKENNGFAESDPEAVSVSTGNLAGYTLSIKSENDNSLKSDNNILTSITETLTKEQYGENNSYVNTWGFKPSAIDNQNNTSYIPGPTAIGIQLAKTNIHSSMVENYSLGIATKVNNDLAAGNYTNTFILTATANEARYTINYDKDSLLGASNAEEFITQTGIINNDNQTINPSTPFKANSEFRGWCDQVLESDGSCNGSIIQPGNDLRMCKCNTDVTLYAMWDDVGSGENIGRNYTIDFTSNFGSPTHMPKSLTGLVNSPYVVIINNGIPELNGYTFLGWCSTEPVGNGELEPATCYGTTYLYQRYYVITHNNENATLYAMWQKTIMCGNGIDKIPASPNTTLLGKKWTTSAAFCNYKYAKDACPSGYRLPTRDDFSTLINQLSYYTNPYPYDHGWPMGNYLSSTLNTSGRPYYLPVDGHTISTQSTADPNSALMIRCIED